MRLGHRPCKRCQREKRGGGTSAQRRAMESNGGATLAAMELWTGKMVGKPIVLDDTKGRPGA